MADTSVWSFVPFRLDASTTSLWRHEQLLVLPPKPFAVLAYLVAHAGEVVPKEALLDAGWPKMAVTEGVLKGCIRQIRQVLGERVQAPQYIVTVHRRGYRFIAPVTVMAASPVPPAETAGPNPQPLIARDAEFAQLHQRWGHALQGSRQIVFVTGEAGMGKTALVDAFVAQLAAVDALWMGRGQCIEQHGSGEAYLPLLEVLSQWGRSPEGRSLVELLRRQAPSWLLHLPALLAAPEYEQLQRRISGTTSERMLRELAEAVETLTQERPVVLVLEDLHWSDYATLDWLALLARRRAEARLLVLGTYRPADAVARAHPVRALTQELQRHGQGLELTLPYFSAAEVAAYLAQCFGMAEFPREFAPLLHHRTNGNPFFLVTVVEELVRQEVIAQQGTNWTVRAELDAVAIGVPESVRQLIEAQLLQVSAQEQEILAAASVVGLEFAAAAVAAGVEHATEEVEVCCDALARRQQFVRAHGITEWPDGTVTARYQFLHDLYREVVYDRIPVSRRVRWHRQMGARLEAGYGPQARHFAAELAEHFVRGRDTERAVRYLHQAGVQAVQRSAHQEALRHLTQGLELLPTLPEGPVRLQHELDLLTALAPTLQVTKGQAAPELEPILTRAAALTQQVGESSQRFAVLCALWTFRNVRAEFQAAQTVAEQLLSLAQRQHDPALLLGAHQTLGVTLANIGAWIAARTHLEQGIALYDPQRHATPHTIPGAMRNYGVSSHAWVARILWELGYPDQAVQRAQEALSMAYALAHPFSLVEALRQSARLHARRREWPVAQAHAEALLALATEHGFTRYVAPGMCLQGWALAAQGQGADGLAQIRQGLDASRATGAVLGIPEVLAWLAAAYGQEGQVDEGLRLLAEALALVDRTGRWQVKAELHLQHGELLLRQAVLDASQAAICFQQALAVARQQQAKSWELRAALSLSRLWQQQDKCEEARQVLAEVYGWFTEGFDTADLQEAKGLLHALSGS